MAKFVKVNADTCIACGACSGEAPDIFDEREDGIAFNKLDDNAGNVEIDEDFLEDLEFAVDSCPTDSIKVQETPFS